MTKKTDNVDIENLIFLGRLYDWRLIDFNAKKRVVILKRKGCRLSIKYDKMNVVSCMNHPKYGTTCLLRRNVDMNLFEDILYNPRVHTELGKSISPFKAKKIYCL